MHGACQNRILNNIKDLGLSGFGYPQAEMFFRTSARGQGWQKFPFGIVTYEELADRLSINSGILP